MAHGCGSIRGRLVARRAPSRRSGRETLLVSSQGMGVAALKPTRRDGTWFVEVVWETTEVSLFLSNPVLVGNTLFGLSEKARGQFFALDADTGHVLWLGQPRQASNTAVVKAGSLLLLLDDDAELIVARSSRSGFEPIKRYTVANSATWAQPTVSGNRVFVKDVTSITLWTLNLNNSSASAVLVAVSVVAAHGQAPDRNQRPGAGLARRWTPAILKHRLSNGLPVWIVEQHELPVVQMSLQVRTGTDADPPGRYGIASLTSAMLTEGAGSTFRRRDRRRARRPSRQSLRVERRGFVVSALVRAGRGAGRRAAADGRCVAAPDVPEAHSSNACGGSAW